MLLLTFPSKSKNLFAVQHIAEKLIKREEILIYFDHICLQSSEKVFDIFNNKDFRKSLYYNLSVNSIKREL